jgi:hypothetical protein
MAPVVPARLSTVPGRSRRAVMVLSGQIIANDIVEIESKELSGGTSGGSKDSGNAFVCVSLVPGWPHRT